MLLGGLIKTLGRGVMSKETILASIMSVALGAIPSILSAQTEEAAIVAGKAAKVIDDVRAAFECDIAAAGVPRFEEFSNAWLAAFTADGPDCDEAAIALMARGREVGATFFRRPNLSQVKAIVSDMRRTLQRGFSCPISIRGEPFLEESSGYWIVNFVGSGADCEDASAELARLGETVLIRFVRTFTHEDARRLLR
jgi:hypothetical protein